MFIPIMVFCQESVDLSPLGSQNKTSVLKEGNLIITPSSIISLHKFDSFKPDSLQFEKFAYDSTKDVTYYLGLGYEYVHGVLIHDKELDIQIYCGNYVVIAKDFQTDSILFVRSKLCGIPTFAFDNCGFKPLKYDFMNKKLYYCQTGIFNNSKRKVLNLKELKRNQ